MKKWIIILSVLLWTALSFANQGGPFGLGIILGEPTGICGKYWLGNTNAIDAAIGFDDFSIHADYLWHFWNVFPQPSSGKIGAYMGPGVVIKDHDHDHDHDRYDDDDDDTTFGIRFPLGIAYETPHHPFEIFVELVPILEFSDDDDHDGDDDDDDLDLELDGAIGVRFFF